MNDLKADMRIQQEEAVGSYPTPPHPLPLAFLSVCHITVYIEK